MTCVAYRDTAANVHRPGHQTLNISNTQPITKLFPLPFLCQQVFKSCLSSFASKKGKDPWTGPAQPLTREDKEDTPSNSNAALGNGILFTNFGAFHAHDAHNDAKETQEERNNHESPGGLDVNCRGGKTKLLNSRSFQPQRSAKQSRLPAG